MYVTHDSLTLAKNSCLGMKTKIYQLQNAYLFFSLQWNTNYIVENQLRLKVELHKKFVRNTFGQ